MFCSSLTPQNTTRNLNAVGDLMGHYRDNNERQSAAIERVRVIFGIVTVIV